MTAWVILGSMFAAASATTIVLLSVSGLSLIFNAMIAMLDNAAVLVVAGIVILTLMKVAPKVAAHFGRWNAERLPYRM